MKVISKQLSVVLSLIAILGASAVVVGRPPAAEQPSMTVGAPEAVESAGCDMCREACPGCGQDAACDDETGSDADQGCHDGKCTDAALIEDDVLAVAEHESDQLAAGPPANRGRGRMGRGSGRGQAGGPPGDPTFQADQQVFMYLVQNRAVIARKVSLLPNGVETLTESNVPQVAAAIRIHVAAMHERVKEVRPIRMRDPLFAAIFQNAGKVRMEVKETARGVLVRETSEDPYVALLIQAHARVVSLFIQNGFPEVQRNHSVPQLGPLPVN